MGSWILLHLPSCDEFTSNSVKTPETGNHVTDLYTYIHINVHIYIYVHILYNNNKDYWRTFYSKIFLYRFYTLYWVISSTSKCHAQFSVLLAFFLFFIKFLAISVKFTSNFYQDLPNFYTKSVNINLNFVLKSWDVSSWICSFYLFFMKSIYKTKNYRHVLKQIEQKNEISKCNQSSDESLAGDCC